VDETPPPFTPTLHNPTSVPIATADLLKKFGHATRFLKELRFILLELIERTLLGFVRIIYIDTVERKNLALMIRHWLENNIKMDVGGYGFEAIEVQPHSMLLLCCFRL
jgi:hypothetical protein